MEEKQAPSHAQAGTETSHTRPTEVGPIAVVGRERLTNAPGKTLTVQVAELPPGGRFRSITTLDRRSITFYPAPFACS